MDNPLTPDTQHLLIEEALHTYPTSPMPRDITPDVMARIQGAPAPHSFRLLWSDLILSLVIAACLGAIWFSLQNLPPLVVAQLRKGSILFYQHILVNARWLVPALAFGLAGLFAALTIPYLRKELMS